MEKTARLSAAIYIRLTTFLQADTGLQVVSFKHHDP